MSRMSAWNRPSKHAAIPPPYYITVGEDTPYCHTCGRVMSTRKSNKAPTKGTSQLKNPVKYCSDRCRRRKLGPMDRQIESVIVSLLTGQRSLVTDEVKSKSQSKKGESRRLVKVNQVEELMFGKASASEKTRTGKRVATETKEWRSVDMESSESELEPDLADDQDHDEDEDHGGAEIMLTALEDKEMIEIKSRKHAPGTDHTNSAVVEHEADSTAAAEKRDEGQKRAEHKEMIRRAARRGVVFGFVVDTDLTSGVSDTAQRRKCEAVVNGTVVEPSFAKGNWGVRWRE